MANGKRVPWCQAWYRAHDILVSLHLSKAPRLGVGTPTLQIRKLRLGEGALRSPYACLSPEHVDFHCFLMLSENIYRGVIPELALPMD